MGADPPSHALDSRGTVALPSMKVDIGAVMTRPLWERPNRRGPITLLLAGLAALSVMGVLAVTTSTSNTVRDSTTVAATGTQTPTPNSTVPAASPTMKAPAWGGDWIGGGKFSGGGWPAS
jgi:hypothetical protein